MKPIPKCPEAEQSLIGTLLHNPAGFAKIADVVCEDDFYDPKNKTLFRTISNLIASKEPVALPILVDKLQPLQGNGIITYAAKLYAYNTSKGPLEAYARIVKEKSCLRKALVQAHGLQKMIKSNAPVDEIASVLTSTAKQITNTSAELTTLREALLQIAEDPIENNSRIRSGIADFDLINGGFAPGELIVVAARPGMGKTMLTLNLARQSLIANKVVGFFSLEMSPVELARRFLALEESFGSNRNPADFNLHIHTGAIGVSAMRSYLERMKTQAYDVALIVIDYLQLMSVPKDLLRLRRDEQISQITRELKLMAGEFNLPVVVVSQLNRECEKRGDSRPILSDLRESGSIEQDADIVLFLYRDEVYNEHTRDKGIAELRVAKYRNGRAGITIKLLFEPENSRFKSIAFDPPPF